MKIGQPSVFEPYCWKRS